MYVQGDLLLVTVAVNPSFFWDTLQFHVILGKHYKWSLAVNYCPLKYVYSSQESISRVLYFPIIALETGEIAVLYMNSTQTDIMISIQQRNYMLKA